MPEFIFTSPEGKKIAVTGPEGGTVQDAFAIAQKQRGSTVEAKRAAPETKEPSGSGVGDFFKSIPGGVLRGATAAAAALGQAEGTATALSPESAELAKAIPSGEQSANIVEKEVTGPLPKPKGEAGKYGEAIGEAIGNPATWVGPGGFVTKALGGVGGATAGEAFGEIAKQINPAWEAAGKLFGGLVGGAAGAKIGAAREGRNILEAIPSQETLENVAKAGYDQIHNAGVTFDRQAMERLGRRTEIFLNNNHIDDLTAPTTFKLVERYFGDLVSDPSIEKVDHVRRIFGNWAQRATDPTERLAARSVVGRIDDYLANPKASELVATTPDAAETAAKVLKNAQGNWSAAKKREVISEALWAAEARAAVSGTGANSVNTMRQEVRKILASEAKVRGFTQAEQDEMEKIVMGTWAGNMTRRIGKMFAPTGLHAMAPSALATYHGGPAVGAAVAGGGLGAKAISEKITQGQISSLDAMIRSRAPLSKPIAARNKPKQAYLDMLVPAGAARGTVEEELAGLENRNEHRR